MIFLILLLIAVCGAAIYRKDIESFRAPKLLQIYLPFAVTFVVVLLLLLSFFRLFEQKQATISFGKALSQDMIKIQVDSEEPFSVINDTVWEAKRFLFSSMVNRNSEKQFFFA